MGRLADERPTFQLQYDPADIPRLAAEFMETDKGYDEEMEDAGRRIVGGEYSRRNLEIICRWKFPLIGLLKKNTDAAIAEALKLATDAKDAKKAVESLTPLAGVKVRMASAILTAIDPKRYTVLDFRALEALGLKKSSYSADFYVFYVEACRSLAKTYGATLRNFDRANWMWSKNRKGRECRESDTL